MRSFLRIWSHLLEKSLIENFIYYAVIFKTSSHCLQVDLTRQDILIVYYYHVTQVFQRESTLYSCLNVKELARNRRYIESLSDSNGIQNHNRLLRKRTLNHLPKRLAKWLSICLRTKCLWVGIPLLLRKTYIRYLKETFSERYLIDILLKCPCKKFQRHLLKISSRQTF